MASRRPPESMASLPINHESEGALERTPRVLLSAVKVRSKRREESFLLRPPTCRLLNKPTLVFHADWNSTSRNRWCATATLGSDGRYTDSAPDQRYDFNLNWTPDQSQFAAMGARVPPPSDDPNAPPSLYTALQEQLGLKLESTKANTDVMVIDHIDKPSAN